MTGTSIERAGEYVEAELVPTAGAADVVVYDAKTAAVLAAMEEAAKEHLDDIRPHKTRKGYERDWALWSEYHGWLAEKTGHPLPLTAVTKGTMVGFVQWLDTIKELAPNTIDRAITGVTVTARREGTEVPKEATLGARQALKPIKNDRAKQARGRGQATAAAPEQLRTMARADTNMPRKDGSRRRRPNYDLPELATYRDRALALMAFAISGRAAEVSALLVADIKQVPEGLEVHVPSVKGRPARDVEVPYGAHPDTCPVLNWLAWLGCSGIEDGPAFRSVDQWGHLGTGRLSPDGCRLVITRTAVRAGISTKLTGHSMRAGFITTSIKAGKRPDQVRKQSGHADTSPVFWTYVRKASRWEDPAGQGIGL